MGEVTLISTPAPVETVTALITEALKSGGRFGVAGGSVIKALGAIRVALGPSWAKVKLTWVDERLVKQADPQSNRGEAYRAGALERNGNLVELPLVQDGESGAAAVRRVKAELKRDFDGGLDVVLLGMGEDGHVASLFPGHRLLDERAHDLAWLDDSPKPPSERVTMTLKVLAQPSLARFVLATGAGKRDALKRLLHGDWQLPVARLGPLTVVTDQTLDS